jgi:hypothetical protein
LVLLIVLVAAAWLWLATPSKVDLADYAPADSLVYVEFNDLARVASAIQYTDVWKAAAPITQSQPRGDNRLMKTAARAGVAPIESVLFTRAQVALVVLGLNTSEQDDTLKVKPDVAVIAETHTTGWRTKPAAVEAVKRLAEFAYGASTCTERSGDADYVECSANGGERKLIGAVDGTLVILGNSDNAVKSCLEVRRGTRPSIRTDVEFLKSRSSVTTEQSLGFGYISSANSAKLFSWAAPLLMGMAPGDLQVQQLLAVSAGKILRGIAWTAVPQGGGIEDRFLFSLEPAVVARLQPAFETAQRDEDIWRMVPGSFQSLTIYRSREPAAAWSSLDSAVAMKLDALPAVLFGSLLRSSLLVYGIKNPKEALAAMSPPLLTMKPPAGADGSVLIARVSDETRLRKSLEEERDAVIGVGRTQVLEGLQPDTDPAKEFTAVFVDGYVILGKTENMRASLAELRKGQAAVTEDKKSVQDSARESTAAIVTYSNDEARLTNFISTLLLLQGRRLTSEEFERLQNTVGRSGFAASETRLGQAGIERRTRSAFGQFSTFTSLLQPDGGAVAHRGPMTLGDAARRGRPTANGAAAR